MRCSGDSARQPRGFTLVEVVVGMILLATLLVSVLQAYGLHHRQLRHARDQLTATQLADRQLSDWMTTSSGVPVFAGGTVFGQPGWSWRTQRIGQRLLAGLPVDIIRYEIFSLQRRTGRQLPLCSVDVVQATPNEPTRLR